MVGITPWGGGHSPSDSSFSSSVVLWHPTAMMSQDPTLAAESLLTTGRVLDLLLLFGQLGKTPVSPDLVEFTHFFHLYSDGDPDGCKAIPGHEYCWFSLIPNAGPL